MIKTSITLNILLIFFLLSHEFGVYLGGRWVHKEKNTLLIDTLIKTSLF